MSQPTDGAFDGGSMFDEGNGSIRTGLARLFSHRRLMLVSRVTVITPRGHRIKRGKIIDEEGIRVWETRVQAYRADGRPKHLFVSRDAWTLSSTILGQLQELGVDRVRFVATDLSETYQISLSEFFRLAEPLDQSKWSGRTEKQYALPRKYWEKTRESANRRQLALQL